MIATTPDRTFFQNLIKIGLPVSLQSMLFSLLGVTDILMVSQLEKQQPQQLALVTGSSSSI